MNTSRKSSSPYARRVRVSVTWTVPSALMVTTCSTSCHSMRAVARPVSSRASRTAMKLRTSCLRFGESRGREGSVLVREDPAQNLAGGPKREGGASRDAHVDASGIAHMDIYRKIILETLAGRRYGVHQRRPAAGGAGVDLQPAFVRDRDADASRRGCRLVRARVGVCLGVLVLLDRHRARGGEHEAEVAVERQVELGLERLIPFELDPDR